MGHRGRCKCGTLLTFLESLDGFKTQCPKCGSIVRLRVDLPPTLPSKRHANAGIPMAVTEPLALALPKPEPFEMPVIRPDDTREKASGLRDFDFVQGQWPSEAKILQRRRIGLQLALLASLALIFAATVLFVILRQRA